MGAHGFMSLRFEPPLCANVVGPSTLARPLLMRWRSMRSRYSAYVLCNEQYLLATWHPSTRPESVRSVRT